MDNQDGLNQHLHIEGFEAEEGKARWAPPHLTKHGTVAELTAGAGSPIAGLSTIITPTFISIVDV